MNDLVSIVMPSYNTANYIADAIQSVINQSYEEWELIIVDDCSTDNTDLVVSAYLNDPRIKYYKNQNNVGAAETRNYALRIAQGKWIAFLDSDDLWVSEKLKKQISFMEQNNYSFSYTNYSEIDSNGNRKGITVSGPKRITKTGFVNYCWPGCLTVMYDRNCIGLIQIANIQKNNDYAMWLKVSRMADCYLLNEELAYYRRGREGSVSSQSIKTLIFWHYRLFRDAEKQSVIMASLNTCRNICFGCIKKIHYVHKANI